MEDEYRSIIDLARDVVDLARRLAPEAAGLPAFRRPFNLLHEALVADAVELGQRIETQLDLNRALEAELHLARTKLEEAGTRVSSCDMCGSSAVDLFPVGDRDRWRCGPCWAGFEVNS